MLREFEPRFDPDRFTKTLPRSAWLPFGLLARAEFNDLEKRCGSRCPERDVDRVRVRALVADIGLVVGAGVATYLFIDHTKKTSVQLGAGWIGVTAAFS